MPAPSYIVGPAAAETLAQLGALERSLSYGRYGVADLVNTAGYSLHVVTSDEAMPLAEARSRLIHAASRLMAAAGKLDDAVAAAPVPA